MRPKNRWVAALILLLGAAACGTGGDTPLVPDAGPSMNGGHATGGNRPARDDGDEQAPATTTVQNDTTSRGGGHATGGN
jgi:hypothetical protein